MTRTIATLLCTSALALGATGAFAMEHGDSSKKDGSKLWQMVDTDNDGKISQNEYRSQSQKWFEKMDQNDDDMIDKDERAAFKQKMREAHKDGKSGHMGDKMQHNMDGMHGDMRGMDHGATTE